MDKPKITIYNQEQCILPLSFFEGRFVPNFHPDSLDYQQWWREQIGRCINGWSDGGYSVPGNYYYHLNFKKINMLNHLNKPFIGNPYFSLEDMDLFKEMKAAREAGEGFIMVTGRGMGKSISPDTELITYYGNVKRADEIVVGDKLMGDDSCDRNVTAVTRGSYDMYKIIPNKGESHTVNGRHMLALYYNHSHNSKVHGWKAKSYINISVEDYIKTSDNIKDHLVLYRRGWGDNFPKLESPEIPPYLLGLWLGDGNKNNGNITNPESEIIEYLEDYANSIGHSLSRYKLLNSIVSGVGKGTNEYLNDLRSLDLINNKHIPKKYLISDRESRMQLLAGLLDTDGYLETGSKNTFEIIQKDLELGKQIVYLARSLDFYVNYTTKIATLKREGKPTYRCKVARITISGDTEIIPTKVERKKAIVRKQVKNHRNTGFKIESIGVGEYVSITTDKNKLFLLKDGTVTHNSYNISSVSEHEFIFYEASEIIISASTDFFAKELWFKVKLGLNSVPDEIRPNFISDTKDYIESGIKWRNPDTGKEKIIGFRSKIHRVVYDNDAGKTRGTRPNIHVFEESGSWSGAAKLIDCYNQTEASWWRGSVFTSFPILIGTGGQMKQGGSEDFKIMFDSPKSFNLRAFEWDGETKGKFVPAYRKFGGMYEKTGESDVQSAKDFLDKRRESKKNNISAYQQELQEFPYDPHEAFMISGISIFDVHKLEGRYAEIKRSKKLSAMVDKCDLEFVREGSKIIGVKKVLNPKGPFEILEHPVLGKDGKPMKGLYTSGCDSYDAVAEGESDERAAKSKGSMFIFKRFWKVSETGRMFAAKITIRTPNASKFYWMTVKLNMYYGTQMLYEHTKIGIAQHYITNKLSHLLYPKPKLDQVKIQRSQSTNIYGVTMPVQVKQHMINRYSEYIDEYVDQMYFPSQILEAMSFRFGSSKFDETMAAGLAILADDDMYEIEVRDSKKSQRSFPKFARDANGVMIFN